MYVSNKIEIQDALNSKSVFAKDEIAKDEIIFEFEKKILDHPTRLTMQIDNGVHQISNDPNAAENFINHSCNPNGFINFNDLTFRARCNIKKGEELTFNYLTTEWDMANKFICNCKSQNCYKNIKGFKYLTLNQQKTLIPYLSPYLRKKLLLS